MHITSKLAGAWAMILLAGCSSLASMNPFAGKSAPRNPPAVLVDFKPTLEIRTAWSTSIGGSDNSSFAPAIVKRDLFAAAADGAIARVDAANGRTVWRINAGMPLTA